MTQTSMAWHDRFSVPPADALLSALDETRRPGFAELRTALLALPELHEEIIHMGVPWRWCFRYTLENDPRFAYLVPDPERPLFALPLPEDALDAMPLRKLARTVRDGLTHARLVGGVVFAEWEVAPSVTGDLVALAQQKHGSATRSG